MPVQLPHLLQASRILLRVQATKRITAITEVAQLLNGHPDLADFASFHDALLARERLESTYIGNGVALPHARTDHARSTVLAVGRSASGIRFENGDQPVRLIFVVATPKSQPGDYLALVGSLCRVLKDPAVRSALLTATTAEEFIGALTREAAQLSSPP